MRPQKPRQIAARVLLEREQHAEFVESLLDTQLANANLMPADRSLAQELVYGVARWERTLDWLIDRRTDQRKQKPLLRILLRLGLYQMFWLERVPGYAAINETVELAKEMRLPTQAAFVNAVLRKYDRERDATIKELAELKIKQPGIGYSHPDWLVERWAARWGTDSVRQLLEWNNTPAKTFARVNTLKTTPEQLAEVWTAETVRFKAFEADWLPAQSVFQIENPGSVAALPSFKQGLFYVQDPSTLLAVRELDPKPGESALDPCSAPGGKTTYIGQIIENRGRIVAQDKFPQRLAMTEENCRRLGVTCAEFTRASGIAVPELTHQFDRVLLDAPCSNTGVLRRRVELRWRVQLKEIARLRAEQLELCRDAAMQTRVGGTFVYSTCSLEPEENRSVVDEFLLAHPGFGLVRERELLPFRDGVDGAYVAVLTRRAVA